MQRRLLPLPAQHQLQELPSPCGRRDRVIPRTITPQPDTTPRGTLGGTVLIARRLVWVRRREFIGHSLGQNAGGLSLPVYRTEIKIGMFHQFATGWTDASQTPEVAPAPTTVAVVELPDGHVIEAHLHDIQFVNLEKP